MLEKRKRLEDRRKLHTYIADDSRNGLADRRKNNALAPLNSTRNIEDRCKLDYSVAVNDAAVLPIGAIGKD